MDSKAEHVTSGRNITSIRAAESARHILMVDDEDSVRTALARALRSSGYVVTAVASVYEAKRLLADARRKLPTGIYRWNNLELAVDSARRLGWRRTTDTGLTETVAFDGAALVRRYAELGLATSRSMTDDALALSLAYLPIWIAEPAQYARWFEVKASGREVTLSTRVNGKPEVAFVLCTFWLVEALADLGRAKEARGVLEHALGALSPLGLMAEDFDPRTRRLWGNFPQAYSHVGLIHAAFAASPGWSEVL